VTPVTPKVPMDEAWHPSGGELPVAGGGAVTFPEAVGTDDDDGVKDGVNDGPNDGANDGDIIGPTGSVGEAEDVGADD
jgi:hypothetical protein